MREVMRQSGKTCFFYFIYPPFAMDTVSLHRFIGNTIGRTILELNTILITSRHYSLRFGFALIVILGIAL